LKLIQQVRGNVKVALARELTKMFEEAVVGDVEDVIQHFESEIKGEIVCMVYKTDAVLDIDLAKQISKLKLFFNKLFEVFFKNQKFSVFFTSMWLALLAFEISTDDYLSSLIYVAAIALYNSPVKFAKEIKDSMDSYERTVLAKPAFPPFRTKEDIESGYYFSLRYNFNNHGISNWYIERI
jgi:hypothetical protein